MFIFVLIFSMGVALFGADSLFGLAVFDSSFESLLKDMFFMLSLGFLKVRQHFIMIN